MPESESVAQTHSNCSKKQRGSQFSRLMKLCYLTKNRFFETSDTYTLLASLVRNFKTAFCGTIQNSSFQRNHKNKSLGLRML